MLTLQIYGVYWKIVIANWQAHSKLCWKNPGKGQTKCSYIINIACGEVLTSLSIKLPDQGEHDHWETPCLSLLTNYGSIYVDKLPAFFPFFFFTQSSCLGLGLVLTIRKSKNYNIILSVIMQKGGSQDGQDKKTKHAKFYEKRTFLYILNTCAYQRIRNTHFAENLPCFVFLLPPSWDSPFCLINHDIIIRYWC